jgi:alkylhydroperoxidase family enzyme
MPRIRCVDEAEATGPLAEIYQQYLERTGRPRVAGILKCFSVRPDFLQDVIDFSNHIHFTDGHLPRRTKEMIATYVSGLNRCPY